MKHYLSFLLIGSFILCTATADKLPVSLTFGNQDYQADYELPVVVLICSYKNNPWITKNLDSVRTQNYQNWRIVYIDDASPDGTAQHVSEYFDTYDLWDKCTLVVNSQRERKLRNMYMAFHHLIDDEEIIIQLDGDDWFAHDDVFSLVNKAYQEHDIWMSYGNCQAYPVNHQNNPKMCEIPHDMVQTRRFRKRLLFMHLRSFYGWLAKSVQLKDLLTTRVSGFQGKFYPASNDAAIMWPMFEMASPHFAFIDQILYILNRTNPMNGFKVDSNLQIQGIVDLGRKYPVYATLKTPVINRTAHYKDAEAACLILSDNNPTGAQRLLESLNTYACGIATIALCYQANTPEDEQAYQQLVECNQDLQLIKVTETALKETLLQYLEAVGQDHLIIARDDIYLADSINVSECIQEIVRTFAYGFYFGLSHEQDLVPDQYLWNDVYAWKFCTAKYAWCNQLDMTLMRTKDVKKRIERLSKISNVQSLIAQWIDSINYGLNQAGLFFATNKLNGTSATITKSLPVILPLKKLD